jgi:hypothetical protein
VLLAKRLDGPRQLGIGKPKLLSCLVAYDALTEILGGQGKMRLSHFNGMRRNQVGIAESFQY